MLLGWCLRSRFPAGMTNKNGKGNCKGFGSFTLFRMTISGISGSRSGNGWSEYGAECLWVARVSQFAA